MYEFLPRTEPAVSVGSASERVTPPVRAVSSVTAVSPRSQTIPGAPPSPHRVAGDQASHAPSHDDHAQAAADYARVVARISSTLSNLGNGAGSTAARVNAAATALVPQPIVVLPLPPASDSLLNFVAGVSQALVQQAAAARAAQANVSGAVVDAATA